MDPVPYAGLLAEPFAFGGPWCAAKTDAVLRLLPKPLAADAELVLATIAGFESVEPGLVHGDLAGHNLHWIGSELEGVLDWDLAAAWDPALNSAYLAMWHGEALLERIAPTPAEAWRARVWLGAMSLESINDVSLNANGARFEAMITKVTGRIQRAALAAGR